MVQIQFFNNTSTGGRRWWWSCFSMVRLLKLVDQEEVQVVVEIGLVHRWFRKYTTSKSSSRK
jgi:hypothetical protein